MPTVALCLGTYGDPRGVGVSYEQSAPALRDFSDGEVKDVVDECRVDHHVCYEIVYTYKSFFTPATTLYIATCFYIPACYYATRSSIPAC